MSSIIYIDADRTGYSTGQVSSTMTIGELVNYLEQFDEDAKVYLRHDNGYTYGGIPRITARYTYTAKPKK